jgi:hypothetical protein
MSRPTLTDHRAMTGAVLTAVLYSADWRVPELAVAETFVPAVLDAI